MTDRHEPSPVAAHPALPSPETDTAPTDAHGFDPNDYEWYPVARRKRVDGWTHTRQRSFIEALADSGSVTRAARIAEMSVTSCYRLRRSPGGENFARAWDAAIEQASLHLADIAFERAIEGVEEHVLDKDGTAIATRRRYNDRLLMFLLRAHAPHRYRYAHGDLRHDGEAGPPPALPLESALAQLAPEAPAAPHLLRHESEIAADITVADLMEGEIPRWHRDGPGNDSRLLDGIDPVHEHQLELSKRRNARLSSIDHDDGDHDGGRRRTRR